MDITKAIEQIPQIKEKICGYIFTENPVIHKNDVNIHCIHIRLTLCFLIVYKSALERGACIQQIPWDHFPLYPLFLQ